MSDSKESSTVVPLVVEGTPCEVVASYKPEDFSDSASSRLREQGITECMVVRTPDGILRVAITTAQGRRFKQGWQPPSGRTMPIPGVVICCRHFTDQHAPIRGIKRFKDQDEHEVYTLVCDGEHQDDSDGATPVVVCGHCVAERDPTLERIPVLREGEAVVRSDPGAAWLPDPEDFC